jgi:hypothetical protein
LVRELCPRYVYSSGSDSFIKRSPFVNKQGYLTRFIGLGSLPGKSKPADSKTTYIQAIELEPFDLA